MNFVDKEYIARSEVGENRSQIANSFNSGSRGDLDVSARLFGDEVSKSCFTKTWRTIKEDMFSCVAAFFGGIE